MSDERCESCRYWEQPDEISISGECHRRSPFLVKGMMEEGKGAGCVWPVTTGKEWCGDHVSREE